LRLHGAPAGSAHAFSFGNAHACRSALKRPQNQFIVFHQVKAHPKMTEILLQNGSDIGQVGNEVVFAGGDGFNLCATFGIALYFAQLNSLGQRYKARASAVR